MLPLWSGGTSLGAVQAGTWLDALFEVDFIRIGVLSSVQDFRPAG